MHLRRYFWGKILRVDCNSTRKTWKDTSIFFFNRLHEWHTMLIENWMVRLSRFYTFLTYHYTSTHFTHAQRSKGVEIYLTYFEIALGRLSSMKLKGCNEWLLYLPRMAAAAKDRRSKIGKEESEFRSRTYFGSSWDIAFSKNWTVLFEGDNITIFIKIAV